MHIKLAELNTPSDGNGACHHYTFINYSRTPLICPPSESHWCGRIRGMVAPRGIGDLHVSGAIVSADALKAEALNEQFNSAYTEEGSIPLPKLGESPYGEIDRLQISISGVLDQLNKLNPSKAQRSDGIPPWFLNTYADQLHLNFSNISYIVML